MATTALDGTPAHTVGELPEVGSAAPDFTLTGPDLGDVTLADAPAGGKLVLSIFPSVGTGVCAASVRRFNELAAGLEGTRVLCVSMDLPFALAGFCGAEGIDGVQVASAFRSDFGETYGARLVDSAFAGLLARAVLVLDEEGTVVHRQLVADIATEPDYDAALASL
ncbi:thiol peroxidase [Nocardioides aestuarii]|uniref:Thiol peroxidase n=1 Tax=Nocardioides aestuarii TaxID=252231 RepID=A0ABW4TN42_9ACTN